VEVRAASHEAVFDVMNDGNITGQTEVVKVSTCSTSSAVHCSGEMRCLCS